MTHFYSSVPRRGMEEIEEVDLTPRGREKSEEVGLLNGKFFQVHKF